MATLVKWLAVSYLISLATTMYLLVRFPALKTVPGNLRATFSYRKKISLNWLGLMLSCTIASFAWGMISIGFYSYFEDKTLFTNISLVLTLILISVVALAKIANKLDKIVITVIIMMGMGVLIPTIL